MEPEILAGEIYYMIVKIVNIIIEYKFQKIEVTLWSATGHFCTKLQQCKFPQMELKEFYTFKIFFAI